MSGEARDYSPVLPAVLEKCTAAAGIRTPLLTVNLPGDKPNGRVRGIFRHRIQVTEALARAPEEQQAFWIAHELGHVLYCRRHPILVALITPAAMLTLTLAVSAYVGIMGLVAIVRPGLVPLPPTFALAATRGSRSAALGLDRLMLVLV